MRPSGTSRADSRLFSAVGCSVLSGFFNVDIACSPYVSILQRDWGNVCEADWIANDRALKRGERLLSSYSARDGTEFWIITEWDRSYTTILLPSDY